jgi:uncharacterized protein YkwD
MAPVAVQIVFSCSDPDGDAVTHLLSYSGSPTYDASSAAPLSLTRQLTQPTEIRAVCRDARGALSPESRRAITVVNGDIQRDSLLLLTNAARASAGAGTLILDTRLTAFAHAHARDMAERNYFSHTTPEGKTFAQRLQDAGLSGFSAGENIAGNSSAQGAVQAWLNSPGHRQNMLNASFRRLGVGVYRTLTSPYTYYVQVFTN